MHTHPHYACINRRLNMSTYFLLCSHESICPMWGDTCLCAALGASIALLTLLRTALPYTDPAVVTSSGVVMSASFTANSILQLEIAQKRVSATARPIRIQGSTQLTE